MNEHSVLPGEPSLVTWGNSMPNGLCMAPSFSLSFLSLSCPPALRCPALPSPSPSPTPTFLSTFDDTLTSGIGLSESPKSSSIVLMSMDRSATSRSTSNTSLSEVESLTDMAGQRPGVLLAKTGDA